MYTRHDLCAVHGEQTILVFHRIAYENYETIL
jgi:hypothetical protein